MCTPVSKCKALKPDMMLLLMQNLEDAFRDLDLCSIYIHVGIHNQKSLFYQTIWNHSLSFGLVNLGVCVLQNKTIEQNKPNRTKTKGGTMTIFLSACFELARGREVTVGTNLQCMLLFFGTCLSIYSFNP